jgi:8-oxo-dGTP diphosphatase
MRIVHAVTGILQKADQWLVAQRPIGKPYAGYWEFPGGKIEENESGESALKRELYEELGIQVISAEYLFNYRYAYPDKIVDLEIWLIKQYQGEPHGKEDQSICWLPVPKMKELNLLAGNWALIDKVTAHLSR